VASPHPTEVRIGGHSRSRASSFTMSPSPMTPCPSSPLMRFLVPTAHEASRSDCHPIRQFPFVSATHQVFLPRFRYVFRLSQPLDVLFLSMPFRPCFVPVALMGFRLRRFPLAGSCAAVSPPNHFDVSSPAGPSSGLPLAFQPPVPVQGFWHPASPLPQPVLPGYPRPVPPLAFFSPRVLSLGHGLRF